MIFEPSPERAFLRELASETLDPMTGEPGLGCHACWGKKCLRDSPQCHAMKAWALLNPPGDMMRTTHHLTETEIKEAIVDWVKFQDKRAANMEVEVTLSHDPGEPPYNQSSVTAAASLRRVQHFEGKD